MNTRGKGAWTLETKGGIEVEHCSGELCGNRPAGTLVFAFWRRGGYIGRPLGGWIHETTVGFRLFCRFFVRRWNFHEISYPHQRTPLRLHRNTQKMNEKWWSTAPFSWTYRQYDSAVRLTVDYHEITVASLSKIPVVAMLAVIVVISMCIMYWCACVYFQCTVSS